jgi:hypothetical protein
MLWMLWDIHPQNARWIFHHCTFADNLILNRRIHSDALWSLHCPAWLASLASQKPGVARRGAVAARRVAREAL